MVYGGTKEQRSDGVLEWWVWLLTMKWSGRIVEEPLGPCREAAPDHSPGLQPWVSRTPNTPCKWRQTGLSWAWYADSVSRANIAVLDWITRWQ